MKKFKTPNVLLIAIFSVCLLASSQASATNFNNFIISGANQASDENREYLIDRVGTVIGQLDVGDSLRGIINFNTVNAPGANLGGTTPNDEFTGLFQVLITGIFPSAAPGGIGSLYTFGADPAFATTYGAGAIAALYTDPAKNFIGDFTNPGAPAGLDDGTPSHILPGKAADVSVGPYATEETFVANAIDGQLWAVLGFLGLPGEGIETVTTVPGFGNILTAFSITSGSAGASGNMGLNLISTGPGFDPGIVINRVTPSGIFLNPGNVDFALSQQLRGISDLDTPFEVSSNTNVSFNATTVPEPSTMLLLGGGLLGLGMLARFRKS